jgi:hypothetical protein
LLTKKCRLQGNVGQNHPTKGILTNQELCHSHTSSQKLPTTVHATHIIHRRCSPGSQQLTTFQTTLPGSYGEAYLQQRSIPLTLTLLAARVSQVVAIFGMQG